MQPMNNFNHDSSRHSRIGFPEIIFGQSKTIEDLKHILGIYTQENKNALVTKLQPDKAEKLKHSFPSSFYDEVSGIMMLEPVSQVNTNHEVAILSAGTSDIGVVNEAYYTLSFLNIGAEKITDIGVAGIHRLTDKLDYLKSFKVLIVIAGFEGLLPTVVGGLLPQPIIAIPASVGYGVAAGGKAALNSMLASCANGITVVNIDNGYGAAMAAVRILNMFNN
jgi:NCAIR mutase (PurE)-related protein